MEQLKLDISVSQLADIETPVNGILTTLDGKRVLDKEYEGLNFIIDYPLKSKCAVIIPKAKTVADLLVPLAAAYKNTIPAHVSAIL